MIFIIIVSAILFIGLLNYFRSKKKNVLVEPKKVITVSEKKPPKPLPTQEPKYPRFIPYYEWHGWANGLHPSTRTQILNEHGKGLSYVKKR